MSLLWKGVFDKMRIIKYRFWLKKEKMMSDWETAKKECNRLSLFEMDNFIPLQFTGLCDRVGVEIYEGDVVKGNHKDNFVIVELCGGPQLLNAKYYGQKYNELIAMPTCEVQTASWLNESEVIGNIYEHGHLLKERSNE